MRTKRLISMAAFVCLGVILIFVPNVKAEYPEKPIELVTHSGVGGGGDTFMRMMASILEKSGIVKQKMIISNRRGGGAAIALNYMAENKGNPYVIMQWTTGPLTTILQKTARLKMEDMVLIGSLVEDPSMIICKADSPYKDLKSVIEHAKKNPKALSIGVHNVGATEHIIGHLLEKAAKVQFNITHFEDLVAPLLGGHVDLIITNVGETMSQVEGKKARALAVVADKRLSYLNNVPTLKELGFDIRFTQYRGFWAGPGFPDYAAKYWDNAFAKLMDVPEWKEYMVKTGMAPGYMKGEETGKFLAQFNEVMMNSLIELKVIK